MFAPTAAAPAAMPRRAAYLNPALYHYRPRAAAPYTRRKLPPARSMAAAVAHKAPAARAAWLTANYARHLAGKPLLWPAPPCNGRPR